MKIKLKDAMKIANKIIEKERRLDEAFHRIEEDRKYMQERIYNLEKHINRLEMKVAEMNGEVNKPGTDNAHGECCTPVRY